MKTLLTTMTTFFKNISPKYIIIPITMMTKSKSSYGDKTPPLPKSMSGFSCQYIYFKAALTKHTSTLQQRNCNKKRKRNSKCSHICIRRYKHSHAFIPPNVLQYYYEAVMALTSTSSHRDNTHHNPTPVQSGQFHNYLHNTRAIKQ